MSNYWKNQGPLAHRFSTKEEDGLPFVCEILEYGGQPMSPEIFEKLGPDGTFALHWGDWGSPERILEVLAKEHDPAVPVTLRIMRKSDGEVIQVVRVDTAASALPDLDILKRLLHYSWSDTGYVYSSLTAAEKDIVSPEQFRALVHWIGEPPPESDAELKELADGNRQDFLDLLDFVKDGMVSEVQGVADLPDGADAALFKALIARDSEWKKLYHSLEKKYSDLLKGKPKKAKKAAKKTAKKKVTKKAAKRKKR